MTATLKQVNVTQEMIETYCGECPYNNPIAAAIKEQLYPDASEIIVTGEGVYVDKVLISPKLATTQFINDWFRGRKVQPMILGFWVT
jgi:hypothetical protein